MGVEAYRSVVVGVSDLGRALGLFRDVMGLRVEYEGALSRSLLDAWKVGPAVTARAVELSCRGYAYGRLLLVEYSPAATRKVRVDHGPQAGDSPLAIGPKAIDFYVTDSIRTALDRVVAAGFAARSTPRKHQIGQSISEEVVVTGPDDLPMLLMVGHRHAATSLRAGSPDGMFSEIATASVIMSDVAASRHFYGDLLGLRAVNDAETPDQYRDLVCELVDAPRGTRVHFLLYASPGEASGKILLIHFFDCTGPRLSDRMRPGHLGFSLFRHDVDDVERYARGAAAAGGSVFSGPVRVLTERGERLVALLKGPNEELLELSQPG